MAAEEKAEPKQEAKPKRKLPMTLILIGGLAAAQAGGFFVFMKMMGGGPNEVAAHEPSSEGHDAPEGEQGGDHKPPADAGHAAPPKPKAESHGGGHGESGGGHGADPKAAGPSVIPMNGVAEMPLVKSFKVPNDKTGRTYIYDIDISIVVAETRISDAETLIKSRTAEIGDAISRTFRGAEPKALKENDFRTIRMQLSEELAEIAGDPKLIQKILIPRAVPLRAE